jgi:hypothetical protein
LTDIIAVSCNYIACLQKALSEVGDSYFPVFKPVSDAFTIPNQGKMSALGRRAKRIRAQHSQTLPGI